MSGKYTKEFSKRKYFNRGGEMFGQGVNEYNSLLNMYKLFPDKVIKPIELVINDSGKTIGYSMLKFDGMMLNKWLEINKISQNMYNDITKTIKGLNEKGLYHGDLPGNIMIDKTGNWKIIDPVGYPHSSKMTKEVLEDAQIRDWKFLQGLKHHISSKSNKAKNNAW